ncbi:MAG: hypothetical protein HXY40_09495 [Chloroflexi bacterium]|nr:hypothetical protein [Chloroflexota bacterium]
MKWLNSDARLLLAALLALTLVAAVTVALRPAQNAPPLSVRSDAANGALALRLWLERLGYRTREVLAFPDDLRGLDALFVLNPLTPFDDADRRAIYTWLRQGKTLIVAGAPLMVNTLVTEDFSLRPGSQVAAAILPAAPTLLRPAVTVLPPQNAYVIDSARRDVALHLVAGSEIVLASYLEAQGTLWLSGLLLPYTNAGLRDEAHARLLLNLLAQVPPGGIIGFDEAHHGFDQSSDTLFAWLATTPPGWGVVGAGLLTFVYLALRGRRFGRALPLPEERQQREAVEYIQAMGGLLRRSGERGAVLRHYRRLLGRRAAERYGFDPHLSDEELLKRLAAHAPALDAPKLRALLRGMAKKQVSEAELLHLVRALDDFLKTV